MFFFFVRAFHCSEQFEQGYKLLLEQEAANRKIIAGVVVVGVVVGGVVVGVDDVGAVVVGVVVGAFGVNASKIWRCRKNVRGRLTAN